MLPFVIPLNSDCDGRPRHESTHNPFICGFPPSYPQHIAVFARFAGFNPAENSFSNAGIRLDLTMIHPSQRTGMVPNHNAKHLGMKRECGEGDPIRGQRPQPPPRL